MIKNLKKIELLAPAKNKECAYAAINAGADAVYIGAKSFGARKKAGNSIEDIKEIVEYAHKFLVKIYVTVNTILYDNEISEAEKLIWQLYEAGVDAVIFQDFAFFEMNLPPIALHASTQCNNDSIEKIKFLKSMNVQRVVLPREFSRQQIKKIIENIDIETEVFVHGALCVSYSGQCYFSNYIGRRSANRGECAQPCRKKYSLVDESGAILLQPQYLLSMKDNNLSKHIKELIEAGVTSLKIEGRLKDKDYVTNVVSAYRKIIDSISPALRTSLGKITTDFVSELDKTFNRTYTDFYFDGKRKIFINSKTPKFLGEYVGEVVSIKGNSLMLNTKISLCVGDKLAYYTKSGELTGTTVTQINGKAVSVLNLGEIKKGTLIHRNYDYVFNKSLSNAHFERKIPADIRIDNNSVTIRSIKMNEITYLFEEEFEKAKNVDKAVDTVVKQFSKLGDTEFFVSQIKVSQDFDRFIPVSKLNEIRRRAISELRELLKTNYPKSNRNTCIDITEYPISELDYSFNISNTKAKTFYEKCGCNVLECAPELSHPKHSITLMKTKHCLRDFAGLCLKNCKDNCKLFLADEYGNKFPLEFDCKNCIMKIETNDI